VLLFKLVRTMKIKKRRFFQLHSWIGINLSILFFIVCFSGTLATLSNELDWLFTPGMRVQPQKELASRNLIVQRIQKRYPDGKLTYWFRPEGGYLADVVYVEENGQRQYVFANPYTGEIQGAANITVQRYFRDLHYYLFIPFQIGNFTVLAFGFLLWVSVITALVFYKNWQHKFFELKTGKGLLVLLRSLHRLIGLWSLPLALLFAVTGIWYFVERADVGGIQEQLYTVVPSIDSAQYVGIEDTDLSMTVNYDRAIAAAKHVIPNLKVEAIGPPHRMGAPLYIYGQTDAALVRSRANRVYLNPITYEVLKVQRAEELNTATWINDIADPLHFGYWGGLPTKILWFISGLGISGLVLSGIWVALRRKLKKKQASKRKVIGVWKYINWLVTGVLLFFMYYFLISRYAVAWHVLAVVTLGWALVIGLSWYIYQYRLKATAK